MRGTIIKPQKVSEIPNNILTRIFSLMGLPLVMGCLIILSGFIFKEFNTSPLLIAALILTAIGALRVISVIGVILTDGYIILNGIVTAVSTEKFDKKTKIIQMRDLENDVSLSFSYAGSRDIEVNTPISLYIISSEPIENKPEIGPYVEGYLQVVFTETPEIADNNNDSDISAADLLFKNRK